MAGMRIEITGVAASLRAISKFDPEIRKMLNALIKESLMTTRETAKGEYGAGSWTVRLGGRRGMVGSIRANGGSRRNPWNTSSPGVRAAIFEFAGTRSPGKTPQARAMIRSLNSRYGGTGRFLWDAWDTKGEKALLRIKADVVAVERFIQSELDRAS